MTSNNPWNNIVTKEFANEKITAAFDDFEMLTTYISTKKYENKDKEYKLQLSFYPQHFVGMFELQRLLSLGQILDLMIILKHYTIITKFINKI